MSHPHQLHAESSLWSLRAALRWLDEHRETVLIRRPQLGHRTTRPKTLAELQQHDQLLRQERAERAAGSLRGLKPSAGSPSPVPPGILDLQREVEEVLADVDQLLAYHHHRAPRHGPWPATTDSWDRRAADLADTTPGLAATIGQLLSQVDARVRAVCGVGPDRWPVPLSPPCPSCGIRRLRVQHSPPDSRAWTLVCAAGCRCAGDTCPCGMPVLEAGVAHIWDIHSPLIVSVVDAAAALGSAA